MLRGVVENDRATSGFDIDAKVGRTAVCRDWKRRGDDIVIDGEAGNGWPTTDLYTKNPTICSWHFPASESRASQGIGRLWRNRTLGIACVSWLVEQNCALPRMGSADDGLLSQRDMICQCQPLRLDYSYVFGDVPPISRMIPHGFPKFTHDGNVTRLLLFCIANEIVRCRIDSSSPTSICRSLHPRPPEPVYVQSHQKHHAVDWSPQDKRLLSRMP